MSQALKGACHCGAIKATFNTELQPDAIAPRLCSCSFCRKHALKWFADPDGNLSLTYKTEPTRYRFGTKTADFLLCPNCGVILAAGCTIKGNEFGILNLNCLDDGLVWPEPHHKSDFDGEGTGDRLARRARNWMPLSQSGSA